jgi:hypothetical protein
MTIVNEDLNINMPWEDFASGIRPVGHTSPGRGDA